MMKKKKTILAAVTLAALGVAGGVAYATIPDGQGVIHACYKVTKGDLRVIDSGACVAGELPLSWNQTGPQGPAGPQGPQGATGASGVEQVTKSTTNVADKYVPSDSLFHERVTLDRFTKQSDATRIRVTWQGPASISGPSAGACTFQLRNDGAKDTGSVSPSIESSEGGDATLSLFGDTYSEAPITDTAYFESLPAGLHYVTVWVSGTDLSDACTTNAGVFPMSVIVEEMP
jgi:hypothetical protein